MPERPLSPQVWLLLMLAGYLCGSIPWGLLIARAKGVDIRKVGSGNIGATNVGRVLGRKLGLLCFVLDMLKGAIPVAAAGAISGLLGELVIAPAQTMWWLGVMVSPVLGHVLNPWLAFKGGKGVATSLGALLGVFPPLTIPALMAFGLWLLAAIRWRYVSLASLLAGASLPLWVAGYFLARLTPGRLPPWEMYLRHAGPFIALSALLAGLVLLTHRANIQRLLAGTENKIGHRKGAQSRTAESATGASGDPTKAR